MPRCDIKKYMKRQKEANARNKKRKAHCRLALSVCKNEEATREKPGEESGDGGATVGKHDL